MTANMKDIILQCACCHKEITDLSAVGWRNGERRSFECPECGCRTKVEAEVWLRLSSDAEETWRELYRLAQWGACETWFDSDGALRVYGMSREKYGVRFDGFEKDDPFAVWAGYGESGMSPEARGALERAGLLDGDDEPWRMRDRADLVMRFIALSMPAGFTYEPVVVPSLNGLLRADIGYGLFEGASC